MTKQKSGHTRKDPLPPKLARPRLYRAYLRQRLLRKLDDMLALSAVWIGAGPGSGKTVLASTYVETRKRPHLWYHVDSRDRYPATLFYYLRCGALWLAPILAQDLLLLTPEYLSGLDVFAQNFFESFFGLLAPGSLLVFDNCQELGQDSVTARLLAAGLEQAPDSVRIILIGRGSPGPAFTHLLASESLRTIDDATLAFDAAEARAIARQHFARQLADETVDELQRLTCGWPAGFTLLLEQTGDAGALPAASNRRVFDYFSAEVLRDIDPGTLETLLQSAWLVRIPKKLLSRQCEDAHAAEQIAALCRRNYFISETGGSAPVYKYHPLFRDCLLQRARQEWTAERLDAVRRRAAKLMIADDQSADAFDLLLELGDWSSAAELLETLAPDWLAEGRTQLLESALAGLPIYEVTARPGLLYWRAACRLPLAPAQARELFAAALDGFESAGHERGCFLAWAGVVDTFVYEWGNFTPLDYWIERFEQLRKRYPRFPDPEAEARAVTGIFTALSYRQPQHPDLPDWTRNTHRLIEGNPQLRLLIGSRLVPYYVWWTGDLTRAASITELLEPQAEQAGTDPLTAVVWHAMHAMELWMTSATQECAATAEHGLQLAEHSGIHMWDFMLLAQAVWGHLTAGDLAQADKLLARMKRVADPARLLDTCHYHFQAFTMALHRGNAAAMHEHAHTALQLARRAGVPWAQGMVLPAVARVLELRGDSAGADSALDEAAALAEAIHSGTISYAALLARTELAIARGNRPETLGALRKFMALCREHDFTNSSWWRSDVMAELCVIALEHDIETDFTRHLIRLRRLVPREPPLHLGNWPWPLEIVTLGRFEVLQDGRPLRFEGKSQKRPFALLKALVALGGHDVPETRLADALWPEAEGDAAQQALATTLHRLRRLIGAAAVQRREGLLYLDPARCRVDLWRCERYLEQAESALRNDNAEGANAALQSALALYHGPFLANDEAVDWAVPVRERLRHRLLLCIVATGGALSTHGDESGAVACYERGLAFDEFAEECHLGMLRCHLESQLFPRRAGRPSSQH